MKYMNDSIESSLVQRAIKDLMKLFKKEVHLQERDKTSGSLFNATDVNLLESMRRRELPKAFFEKWEKSTTADSGFSLTDFAHNVNNYTITKRFHSRSHFDQIKELGDSAKYTGGLGELNARRKSNTGTAPENIQHLTRQKNSLNNPFIAKMNRQYDHNICLDRFIHGINEYKDVDGTGLQMLVELDPRLACPLDRTNGLSPEGCTNESRSCSSCSSSIESSTHVNGNSDKGKSKNGKSKNGNSENGKSGNGKSGNGNSENGNSENGNSGNGNSENGNSQSVISSKINIPLKSKPTKCLDQKNEGTKLLLESRIGLKCLVKDLAPEQRERLSSGIESGVDVHFKSGTFSSDNGIGCNYNEGANLWRKRSRDYNYDPNPLPNKIQRCAVAGNSEDNSFCEKPERNIEAIRNSRAVHLQKELEIVNLIRMKKENHTLRVAIASLINRNASLESILQNHAASSQVQKR